MMSKVIVFLLLLGVSLVAGSEQALRGAEPESESELIAELKEMMAEAAKEEKEPPRIRDLLQKSEELEQKERDLQWWVNRNPTLNDIVEGNKNLVVLDGLLDFCGLKRALRNRRNSLTLFAPRDHAFSLLDEATVESLIASKEICNILLYHMIQGELYTNSLSWRRGGPFGTLHGNTLTTETTTTPRGRRIRRVNGYSRVSSMNRQAVNGVVQIINQVLLPYDLPEPEATPPVPELFTP